METSNKPATFSALIQSDKPVLVDFFAEWCGPCKMMRPILEELKRKIDDKAVIVKVDVDRHPAIASMYNIQSIPTLAIFKHDQLLWRQSGVLNAQQLADIIQRYY